MNIDRDDEYATRYEAAPTITLDDQIATQRRLVELYEVDKDKNNYDLYRQRIETAILASLEKLAALESQPVPVEPEIPTVYYVTIPTGEYASVVTTASLSKWRAYINTMQSALKLAQSEAATFEAAYKPEAQRADKAESLNRRMVELLKRLSFLAQTTGGTAGRDDELVKAIDESAELLKEAGQ